ncbi:unnamed protein product [Macrosiphum euphorbiae]|uniref:Uncharacterized protein n=1 Tax=Macrosiphum euphorbiae TaxID=13131 RepID=A0AAV0Y2B6_9HEMI|nr:unnamed protein product [Macrosiphum euphorbiae]
MAFLKSLQQQTEIRNLSIGELTKDLEYPVNTMSTVETKFKPAVQCILQDPSGVGIINVFLPKTVRMTGEEINRYNLREVDPVRLIFRGMNKRSFIIAFV